MRVYQTGEVFGSNIGYGNPRESEEAPGRLGNAPPLSAEAKHMGVLKAIYLAIAGALGGRLRGRGKG